MTGGEFINQYGILLFGVFGFVQILLLAGFFMLYYRWKGIFRDGARSVDGVLTQLQSRLDHIGNKHDSLDRRTVSLEGLVPKHIRYVGVVRYNPFSDAGGDQSFVLALMNEERNGVVVSSLYGREMNRVYAKPLEGGGSTYQLSEEEREAISRALSS